MCRLKFKFIVIVILSSTFVCFSQYFEGGIIAGITASQIDGDTFAGYHQPGLTGGFFTTRKFTNILKGVIELKYTAKGARETGSKDDPILYSVKLRYVEMPVKANFIIEKYKIEIESGLGAGYLFYKEGDYNQSALNVPYRKFELSWIFGVNYKLSDYLKIALQYNYSLLPVRKYNNVDYDYGFLSRTFWLTQGDYNNVVDLAIYYQFGKK